MEKTFILANRRCFQWRVACLVPVMLTAACSHLNPYEDPGKKIPQAAMFSERPQELPVAAQYVISPMWKALERTDAHRVRLHGLIAQIGSERDAYDAALWFVAVPLLAAHPSPKAVAGTAVLFANWFNTLDRRPKDLVPRLQRGVKELSCLRMAYTPYLFTAQEYGFGRIDVVSVSYHTGELKAAILDYQAKSAAFVAAIKPVAGSRGTVTCATGKSADCDERYRHKRVSGTSGNRSQIEAYAAYSKVQADKAWKVALQAQNLDDRIQSGAPHEVDVQTHMILEGMGADLEAGRAPLLAADKILAAIGKSASDIKTAIGQSGRKAVPDSILPPQLEANNQASQELKPLVDEAERKMNNALRTAEAFLNKFSERKVASDRMLRERCGAVVVAADTGAGRETNEGAGGFTRLEDGK